MVEQTTIAPLGHERITVHGVAPTCEDEGHGEFEYCARRNRIFTDKEITPALGHQIVIDHGYDPTETANGLTDGAHCDRCHKVLTPQQTIEKTVIELDSHLSFDWDDNGNGKKTYKRLLFRIL